MTASSARSASTSEKHATHPVSTRAPSSAPARTLKLPSCVVCRNRKVRCDKEPPCSNCRRANIACVFPSTDRPPRWARRLERLTHNAVTSDAPAHQDIDPGVDKAMDRLRNLENLVKELRGQLEQSHTAASSARSGLSGVNSPGSSTEDYGADHQKDPVTTTDTSSLNKQFGRLVLQDASRSRYVSSGFWSRVNDEVSRPTMVTPSS